MALTVPMATSPPTALALLQMNQRDKQIDSTPKVKICSNTKAQIGEVLFNNRIEIICLVDLRPQH